MLSQLHSLLSAEPLLALFITIILGYVIGKFRVKTFVLGGIAGSLIMGVVIGQLGISISPAIGSIFFALFIYAVGYQGGPQFFRSLNKNTITQLFSATITCVLGLLCVLVSAWVFHLDRGTAAGLAAGGLTQSAIIGTASAAIAKLSGVSAHAIKVMQSNVAIGYAVCYIFGSFGPIILLSAIFPAFKKWNLREEAKKLAKVMGGNKPSLEPGQFDALHETDTRIFKINHDSLAIGKTAGNIFANKNHITIEALVRENQLIDVTPETVVKSNDIVAVTAKLEEFLNHKELFSQEMVAPDIMQLTEEARSIILTNKQFDGKTIRDFFALTEQQGNYGVFVNSVSRLGEKMNPDMDLTLRRGDEIELRGRPVDLNRITQKLGKFIKRNKVTDFIIFAIGMSLGILIGMITFHIHGIAISIGSGGGCLFTGLFFGWLRSRHPAIGALPEGASNFLRDFGLAVFVATIGITAGPQALTTIEHSGAKLFLLGVGVTLIPQIITFFISYYWLKIKNPIILLSTIAGGRSANPGFAALLDKAGNSTPVVPFTATYALANIWLTLWGPIVVALVAINAS